MNVCQLLSLSCQKEHLKQIQEGRREKKNPKSINNQRSIYIIKEIKKNINSSAEDSHH